ncbi:MAG: cupin domain-containing protein [Candidatus Competibacteraceae bacterium]
MYYARLNSGPNNPLFAGAEEFFDMPSKKSSLWSLLAILGGTFSQAGVAADDQPASQTLYPAGSQQSFKGPETYFTGEVQVDMLFPGNDTAHYSGAYVTFQPAARTAWHLHPAGQHMIVTSGIALTGTRDGKIIEFKAGETVWCPPNLDHWHGATPHAKMTHLVITGSLDDKNVIWKEKVSDEAYYGNRHASPRWRASTALMLSSRHTSALQPISG